MHCAFQDNAGEKAGRCLGKKNVQIAFHHWCSLTSIFNFGTRNIQVAGNTLLVQVHERLTTG